MTDWPYVGRPPRSYFESLSTSGPSARERANLRLVSGPITRLAVLQSANPTSEADTHFHAMQLPHISLKIDGPVAVLTLKGEDESNRVSAVMCEDLAATVEWIRDDESVRVVVVRGEGSMFSGGTEEAVREMRERGGEGAIGASGDIARLPMPVIAAINGDASGLGLELALACDLRIASDEAVFAMDQIRFGMMPWDGGTQRLPRLVGKGRGAAMVLTGMKVSAEEALGMGLVHAVFPKHTLWDEALSLANKIAGHAPVALEYAKETIGKGMDMTLDQGLRMEQDLTVILQSTADRAEGIRSFLEKRKPEFHGE